MFVIWVTHQWGLLRHDVLVVVCCSRICKGEFVRAISERAGSAARRVSRLCGGMRRGHTVSSRLNIALMLLLRRGGVSGRAGHLRALVHRHLREVIA